MSEMLETPVPPTPSRPGGWGVLGTLAAWVIILGAVGLVILSRFVPLRPQAAKEKAEANQNASVILRLQLRYLIGAGAMIGDAEALDEQLKAFNRGTVLQRLRVVTAIGELSGPGEALRQLAQLREEARQANVAFAPREQETAVLLKRLYTDYERKQLNAPSLRSADREALADGLGEWYAALALHPEGGPNEADRAALLASAQRTFLVLFAVLVVALTLGVLGFVGLILAGVFVAIGMIRLRFATSVTAAHAGVYAEAFALWLLLYPGLTLLAEWFVPQLEMLPRAAFAMLLSLVALLWPTLRNVPWTEVRSALGWSGGVNPIAEFGAGLLCYVINLPIVFVGCAITFLLLRLQGSLGPVEGDGVPDFSPGDGLPTHPIVRYLTDGDLRGTVQLYVLAALIAPLVEETMFRGLLYRHLRELTAGVGRLTSFLLSSFVVCLLFAAIHPQGLSAIPVLMALAFGFCLAREWRDSLLPAIFVHALNNATVITIGMLALAP